VGRPGRPPGMAGEAVKAGHPARPCYRACRAKIDGVFPSGTRASGARMARQAFAPALSAIAPVPEPAAMGVRIEPGFLLVTQRGVKRLQRGPHRPDRLQHRVHALSMASVRPMMVSGISARHASCAMSAALADAALNSSNLGRCASVGLINSASRSARHNEKPVATELHAPPPLRLPIIQDPIMPCPVAPDPGA
jgi:hypothetical protein